MMKLDVMWKNSFMERAYAFFMISTSAPISLTRDPGRVKAAQLSAFLQTHSASQNAICGQPIVCWKQHFFTVEFLEE